MQIKIFKQKNNFKKKRIEPNPNFYWKLTVMCTLILTLASFAFGYYMFIQVNEDTTDSIETINKKQPIEKERLDKALEYYSSKEKRSNQIMITDTPVSDPSL